MKIFNKGIQNMSLDKGTRTDFPKPSLSNLPLPPSKTFGYNNYCVYAERLKK